MTTQTKPKPDTKQAGFAAACEKLKDRHIPPPNDHRDIAFLTSGRGVTRKYRRGW